MLSEYSPLQHALRTNAIYTSTNRGHSTNYYANGHLHIADIVQAKAFLDSTYNPSTSRITLTFINWGACFFKRKKKSKNTLFTQNTRTYIT